jgi:lipopolysaccharide/colanic/teichoic acid biosynthesis glycosyltransferase
MVRGADAIGLGRAVSTRDRRITRVGRLLRRLSLDELPQLWSVVRGEMSIVGPRPTIPDQVRRYSARHLHRLRVKPGITGLAQVSGRNRLTWDERIELDLIYIETMSPAVDAVILLRTPFVILAGVGLFSASGVTYDYGERDEKADL